MNLTAVSTNETDRIAVAPREAACFTVGITTRNRAPSLHCCLASLRKLAPVGLVEVIVIDDASETPVEEEARRQVGDAYRLRVLRQETNQGYIAGRNRIVAAAGAKYVLLLDDDTRVDDAAAVETAVAALAADESLAAIAFAQAEPDGKTPWPAGLQPAAVDRSCLTPSYIGFAHLLRRDLFMGLGGYREIFWYYGEEKEFCLRALDAGYHVLYLPDCRIAHLADPGGRDPIKYYRYVVRNDCLTALFTFPLPLASARVAARVAGYHRLLRRWLGKADPEGRRWLINELKAAWPAVRRGRTPVRWRTLFEWKRLQREHPRYLGPTAE